jgi:4-hydroxy-tetrahydrodipicolinate synthase
MEQLQLSGAWVALVTPFLDNQEIDYESFKKLLIWHAKSGITGIVILGTTGENAGLLFEEHLKLIQFSIEILQLPELSGSSCRLMVGVGTYNTHETVHRIQEIQKLGESVCSKISALLIVTPYYNRPSQEGLIAHYNKISQSTSFNIVLYNVPKRTGVDLLPETVRLLSDQNSNIIGLKETVCTADRLRDLKNCILNDKHNFLLFSGEDSQNQLVLEFGGHGMISVTANIVPSVMQDFYINLTQVQTKNSKNSHFLKNNLAFEKIFSDLNQVLFLETNPVGVKWALSQLQKIKTPMCRLPLVTLSKKYQSVINKTLKKLEPVLN